jgi:hypothetical protein
MQYYRIRRGRRAREAPCARACCEKAPASSSSTMRLLAALCALALAAPAHATRETLRFDFGALSSSAFSLAFAHSAPGRPLS